MSDVNLDAPVAAVSQQRQLGQSLLGSQQAQNSDFLNRYTGAIKGQETTAQTAARLGNQVNLPQLQQNATNLQNTIGNLPGTYKDATNGFNVNANQLQRIVGQKTYDLTPALTSTQNALSNAQNTVNTQLGYTQADQQKALMPYQTEQQLLGTSQQNALGVFNQQNSNELNALLAKMNAGVTMTEGDLNRANQLAVAKEQADNQQKIAQMQQQYQPLGYGGIYNTANGQTIDTSRLTNVGKYGTYDPTTGQLIGGGNSGGGVGGGSGGTSSTSAYLPNNSGSSFDYNQYISG